MSATGAMVCLADENSSNCINNALHHAGVQGTPFFSPWYQHNQQQLLVPQGTDLCHAGAPRTVTDVCNKSCPLKNTNKIKTLFFSFNIGRVFDKATWLWTLAVLLFCTVALQFFAFFENETVDFEQVPVVKWSFCLETYLSKEAFKEHVVYFANTYSTPKNFNRMLQSFLRCCLPHLGQCSKRACLCGSETCSALGGG